MPSWLLCIVSDRRGEWPQCEEGPALFPANVPAHVLTRPPCVSKREEMIQNVVFFPPQCGVDESAVIPDGGKMVLIPAILWFRGHVMLLKAPTTPARNPNVTPSITGFHPPHIRPPHIRNPFLGTPGGQERPRCTWVGVSLCASVMFPCCLCCPVRMLRSLAGLQFPGREAPPVTRGLEIPEGQWEGADPTGPPAQPPGVMVV